jgi:hypothetical protein
MTTDTQPFIDHESIIEAAQRLQGPPQQVRQLAANIGIDLRRNGAQLAPHEAEALYRYVDAEHAHLRDSLRRPASSVTGDLVFQSEYPWADHDLDPPLYARLVNVYGLATARGSSSMWRFAFRAQRTFSLSFDVCAAQAEPLRQRGTSFTIIVEPAVALVGQYTSLVFTLLRAPTPPGPRTYSLHECTRLPSFVKPVCANEGAVVFATTTVEFESVSLDLVRFGAKSAGTGKPFSWEFRGVEGAPAGPALRQAIGLLHHLDAAVGLETSLREVFKPPPN